MTSSNGRQSQEPPGIGAIILGLLVIAGGCWVLNQLADFWRHQRKQIIEVAIDVGLVLLAAVVAIILLVALGFAVVTIAAEYADEQKRSDERKREDARKAREEQCRRQSIDQRVALVDERYRQYRHVLDAGWTEDRWQAAKAARLGPDPYALSSDAFSDAINRLFRLLEEEKCGLERRRRREEADRRRREEAERQRREEEAEHQLGIPPDVIARARKPKTNGASPRHFGPEDFHNPSAGGTR